MEEPKPANSEPPRRLPLLDGLRGFAAIGVLLYHVPRIVGFPSLVSRTYLFVDIFFLLSGFVLTLSAEPRMARGMTPAGFMTARIRRLWPMMALGTLIAVAVFATQAPIGAVMRLAVLGLLVVPILRGGSAIFPLNAPQWSLMWELVANLCHGLVLRRLGSLGLLALASVLGMILVAGDLRTGCTCFGPNVEYWWLAGARIGWSYVLGIWMARRWTANRPAPVVEWRMALLLPLAALFALPYLPLSLAAGDALIVIAVFPPLFRAACTATPPARYEPLLERLGSLSFPLYALQVPIIVGSKFIEDTWRSQTIAAATALAAAAAVASAGPRLRKIGLWRQLHSAFSSWRGRKFPASA
jgi:peptidoglycan/LPS O-acetylase OafA/YrhL